MSDRPTASNGKRHVFWGTLRQCPACARCLCFGCHPDGPCVDEHEVDSSAATEPRRLRVPAAALPAA